MHITTKSLLAIRTLLTCAGQPDRQFRKHEIAAALDASENHLAQVVHQLGRKGFLTTQRGRSGGLRLARPPEQITLGEVMTRAVAVVRQDDRLGMAEALMRSKRVRRLPVVDVKDRLLGLLSLNDVARAAQQQRGRRMPDVAGDEVITTLGAICEPRRLSAPMPAVGLV